jgi:hypothetical protein
MRALFSLACLLVVVAIVLWVANKQLQAVAPSAGTAPVAGTEPATPQQRSRTVQQKVLQDINQSLQQGAERAADSKP